MVGLRYMIFGDLHGRILPAFHLARRWEQEYGLRLDGLLQVGDLGYFPDLSRLDRATARHAAADPLELGACFLAGRNAEADAAFIDESGSPPAMWFTAGNHEDFLALADRERDTGKRSASFAVDAYGCVRCIRDGRIEELPGPLRVAALWGIDDQAPNARRKTPERGRIRESSALALGGAAFDVLLSHDGPRDAVLTGSGSEAIGMLISEVRPSFAFFGHYGSRYGQVEGMDGGTQVYHLAGFELRRGGSRAEPGSVGLLTWENGIGAFQYLDESWLGDFTRYSWRRV